MLPIVPNLPAAFNRKGGSKSPRNSAVARAGAPSEPPLGAGDRVTNGHAPCDPLSGVASLIHTECAIGIPAIAAVTSVPAWPALAVVTRTSICLRPQATRILRRQLPAQQTTQRLPHSGGGFNGL